MKEEGYGAGYRYAHDDEPEGMNDRYLPDDLAGRIYYEPRERGERRGRSGLGSSAGAESATAGPTGSFLKKGRGQGIEREAQDSRWGLLVALAVVGVVGPPWSHAPRGPSGSAAGRGGPGGGGGSHAEACSG